MNLLQNEGSFCPIHNYIYFVLCAFHGVFLRGELTGFQLGGLGPWEGSWLGRGESTVGVVPGRGRQPGASRKSVLLRSKGAGGLGDRTA